MKKAISYLLAGLAAAWVMTAVPCAAQAANTGADDLARAPRISLAAFKQLLSRGDVLVLDVRDAESYKNGHIPGARSLPLADLGAHAAELRGEKRPIVAYCA